MYTRNGIEFMALWRGRDTREKTNPGVLQPHVWTKKSPLYAILFGN